MTELTLLAIGLMLGGLLVWLWTKVRGDESVASSDKFKVVATDALRNNNQIFLDLAKQTVEKALSEGKGDLEKREQAIEGLVKPLQETLQKYNQQINAMEESRQKAEGGLEAQLKLLAQTNQQLQRETGNLINALRNPQVRGRWGELTLRRVAELAGMVNHCDFQEQVTYSGEEGRTRPDMVVYLPNSRQVAVDSKVPLDAYLLAIEATVEEERESAFEKHSKQLRNHMTNLASKSYWEQLQATPEFVVMFIPGEPFLAAAVQRFPSLIEEGLEENVVIATPTTLVALLKAVAYGWRQEVLTENAREIGDLARELYKRTATLGRHLVEIGKGLDGALESYNKAVGSLESRWLPLARKIKELRETSDDDIPTLEPIRQTPRVPTATEATEVLQDDSLDAPKTADYSTSIKKGVDGDE